VLTDRPVLAWFKTNYGLGDVYVSPVLAPNPFSFVYASGSPLRQYVNPAVIAAQTDPNWIGLSDQLTQRYFGSDIAGSASTSVETPLDYNSIISAAVLGFVTLLMSLLNGNACPSMPERVQHAFCAPPRPGPAGDAMVELNDALENAAEKLQALRDAVYHAGAHTAGNGDSKWAALDAWTGSGRFSNVGSPRTARSMLELPSAFGSGVRQIPSMKLGAEAETPVAAVMAPPAPVSAPPERVPTPQQLPPLPPPAGLAPVRTTPSPQQRPPSRPPSAPLPRAWPPQPHASVAVAAAPATSEEDRTFAEMSAALQGPAGANAHRHRHRHPHGGAQPAEEP
jgi:hypothetical protein